MPGTAATIDRTRFSSTRFRRSGDRRGGRSTSSSSTNANTTATTSLGAQNTGTPCGASSGSCLPITDRAALASRRLETGELKPVEIDLSLWRRVAVLWRRYGSARSRAGVVDPARVGVVVAVPVAGGPRQWQDSGSHEAARPTASDRRESADVHFVPSTSSHLRGSTLSKIFMHPELPTCCNRKR